MRLIAHIGAQKTATTYIQHALFRNTELLAEHGIYLPVAGRLELAPRSVCHHHLAWEHTDPTRFRPRAGGWDALRAEVAEESAETVLVSSEGLASMVHNYGKAAELLHELTTTADQVTVVLVVREQLGMMNSSYAQAVKMFSSVPSFDEYVDRVIERGAFDFHAAFEPFYDAPGVELVVLPFSLFKTVDPLLGVLGAAGLDVPAEQVSTIDQEMNVSLGPVGVEAARLLGHYLRGRYRDFNRREDAARKLYRIAARHARAQGWCDDRYWGWTPERAAAAAEALKPGNDAFAQAVWGKDWDLPMPVDSASTAVELDDLDPRTVEDIHDYVFEMAERFARQRRRVSKA